MENKVIVQGRVIEVAMIKETVTSEPSDVLIFTPYQ